MTQTRVLAAALVALCAVACADTTGGGDGGTASRDGATADGATADGATADGGTGDGGPPGLPIGPAVTPPFTGADVLILGPAANLDTRSAIRVGSDGRATVVFDTFDRSMTRAELYTIANVAEGRFGIPRPIGFTPEMFEASPSFLDGALYFAASDALLGTLVFYRGVIAAPEVVVLPDEASTLFSWPQLARLDDDTLGLAFRDSELRPSFASGTNDLTFGPSVIVDDNFGEGATVASFGDASGEIAFAYHREDGARPMVSYVRTSSDLGATWSAEREVSGSSDDVHHPTLVARPDGALDVYYAVVSTMTDAFVLYRRAMASDGSMGVEERLSADDVGEPIRPRAHRLDDGTVLLVFVNIADRNAAGVPSRQEITLVRLTSEAPAP